MFSLKKLPFYILIISFSISCASTQTHNKNPGLEDKQSKKRDFPYPPKSHRI